MEICRIFQEESGELLTLDTSESMNDDIVEPTRNIVKTCQQQYYIFVSERFVEKSKPINNPIPKNKLSFKKKHDQRKQTSNVIQGWLRLVLKTLYSLSVS